MASPNKQLCHWFCKQKISYHLLYVSVGKEKSIRHAVCIIAHNICAALRSLVASPLVSTERLVQ